MKRAVLERTITVSREVVQDWRPVAWSHAVDEFDREIRAVAIASARGAAAAIARVFHASLSDPRFTESACADVGRRLFDRLRAEKLAP